MTDVRTLFFDRIAAFFAVDRNALEDDTTASHVDGWDSLRHAELILDLEESFEVELPLAEVQAANNLGDLATVVEKTVIAARKT